MVLKYIASCSRLDIKKVFKSEKLLTFAKNENLGFKKIECKRLQEKHQTEMVLQILKPCEKPIFIIF